MAGGLLLAGSMARWLRHPGALQAGFAALGWSVVWLHRPYEAVVLAALVAGVALWHTRRTRRPWLASFLLPPLPVLGAALALTLAHNRAVTGDPWKLPYMLAQEQQGVPQSLLIQKPILRPAVLNKRQAETYERKLSARNALLSWPRGLFIFLMKPWHVMLFFWGGLRTFLTVAALADRRHKWTFTLLALLCGQLAAASLYPFFALHMIAGVAFVPPLLIAITARRMFLRLRLHFGLSVAGWFMTALFLSPALEGLRLNVVHLTGDLLRTFRARNEIASRLNRMPGRHLVLVRCGPEHEAGFEWVFNGAAIDNSNVVWAARPEPADLPALLSYFSGRRLWTVEADAPTPVLQPLSIAAALSAP
jgi:hypothetical protein